MKKLTFPGIAVLFILAVFSLQAADDTIPAANSAVTFLYYKDLAAAENFYGNILGLEKDFDGEWVKIFRVTNGGRVGLVDEANGYLKTAKDKPVMFSIDTPDVDGWYARLKAKGPEYIKTHPKQENDGFVKSFLVLDPQGYHVEFFQWKEEHKKY